MDPVSTDKLYYSDPYAVTAQTLWMPRWPGVIALERSIAFPEGGGQIGDRGEIHQRDRIARFEDTHKSGGRLVGRDDFPDITVGGEVQLHFASPLSQDWNHEEPVTVHIDVVHRASVTRSHTAAHLAYLGILEVLPDARTAIRGCYIEPLGGRFDLQTDSLTADQVAEIQKIAMTWQAGDYPIKMEGLPDEPECRTWVCNGLRIPCGGTHLPRTGLTSPIELKRRRKGKNLERIYYTLLEPVPAEWVQRYGGEFLAV